MTEYRHEAMIVLAEDGDARAPGGAITTALCGHWEHEPPCRWPHRTEITATDGHHLVTTTFTADPADEADVRQRITGALASGFLSGPDGRLSRWSMLET